MAGVNSKLQGNKIQKTNYDKPTSAASTRINVMFIGLLVVTANRIRPQISLAHTFSLSIAYNRRNQALLKLYVFSLEKHDNSRKSKYSSNQTQLKTQLKFTKSLPRI
jgi:hypothetical protein